MSLSKKPYEHIFKKYGVKIGKPYLTYSDLWKLIDVMDKKLDKKRNVK